MPEEDKKEGLCPICDSKVALDATKCPECKADLSLFGVKTGDESASDDVDIPDEESIEALLGEIGKKDGAKEGALFDEIMAAVDKTETMPKAPSGEPIVDEKIEEVVEETKAVVPQQVAEPQVEEAPSAAEPQVEEEPSAAEPKVEEAPSAAEPVMFECPLCNTLVSEDADTCPGCGAIFADSEEEADAEEPAAEPVQETVAEPEPQPVQAEPEVARTAVEEPTPSPAPTPGVDERSLRKELTQCVAEVKPLLAGARQYSINVLEGRKLIDQAIAAGKKREFESAISLVKQSKKAIQANFAMNVEDTISGIQAKINALKKAGASPGDLEEMVKNIQGLLAKEQHIEAAKLAKTTSEKTEDAVLKLKSALKEKRSDEEADVADKVKNLVELIKSGEEVRVNVKGAKTMLTQARLSIKKNEWSEAERYLTQAKDDFLKELPKQITDIISNSKPMLYKAKMQGVDIRPSIKLLKEASTALKLNNYLDALEAIKRYRMEMNQYLGES